MTITKTQFVQPPSLSEIDKVLAKHATASRKQKAAQDGYGMKFRFLRIVMASLKHCKSLAAVQETTEYAEKTLEKIEKEEQSK